MTQTCTTVADGRKTAKVTHQGQSEIVVLRTRSLESLSDVGKSDGECLDGTVRVLKVQSVRVVVDASELHHLT